MNPMLASKWEARNETMFPYYAQPKLDGIRVVIRDGYAYTRSLKPVRSTWIQSRIRRYRDVLDGLDGELIVGEPTAPDCYVRTNSAVMSFDNGDACNFTFWVFDIVDTLTQYENRYMNLGFLGGKLPEFCQLVPTEIVHNMEDLLSYEEKLLSEGHEGVILRRGDTLYKHGRGTPKQGQLIKKKQFVDTEGTVIGVHELMHNGNPATINALGYTEHSGHKAGLVPMNTLGALEVVCEFQGRPSESVRIGSGFTEEMRRSLWARKDDLIGQTVKFKYFPIGVKDKPRFPIFLGFRDRDDMDAQGSLL